MQSYRQARPSRPATSNPGRRRAATVLCLVVLALPVGLALQGSGAQPTRAGNAVHTAGGTQPGRIVAQAISFVASTTTALPTTVAPATVAPLPPPPPATEPPVTEPPATAPPATEPPVTEPPVTEPPPTAPPATEPPAPEPPPRRGGEQRTVHSTAYCGGGTTASGAPTSEGGVAMNSAELGSQWRVVGSGAVYTVTDRIGSGSEFDIFFSSCGAANAYGRQTITIERVG